MMPRYPVDNLRGAPWMLAAAVCMAATAVAVKHVGSDLSAPVIAFFRSVVGVFVILPFFARYGVRLFATKRPGLHTVRVFGSVGSLVLGFYAVTHLPLATATSL